MPTSFKTAIVTGDMGFIGSHLRRHLEGHGYRVEGIDIKRKWASQDVRNTHKYLSGIDGDTTIFHLAGLADIVPSIENPSEYVDTNVMGTLRVLEAARAVGAKIVYAASSSCYGDNPPSPTAETDCVNPRYPYALSKLMGEQLILHWAQVYKSPAVSLRLFNVYGRGSRTTGAYGAVMGVFLKQKLEGKPMTVVGDGNQKRDFIHVSDVCRAFRMAAESEVTGVFNVGSGMPTSINQLTKLIGGEIIHIPKRPGEPEVTCADIRKIERELDWHPRVPLVKGIVEMLAHIEDYRSAPLWNEQSIGEATKTWFETLA
jgi:UDP-glucose 4-epimerase